MIILAASNLYGHLDGLVPCFSITPYQVIVFITWDAKALVISFLRTS